MNNFEAAQVLGIDPNADQKEIKNKFRKLAAKYHPDVCKEDGAEDKFKKVNEAYQVLTNPAASRVNPAASSVNPFGHNPFNYVYSDHNNYSELDPSFFEELFRKMNQHQRTAKRGNIINLGVERISFKDSILGTSKKFDVEFDSKCISCSGSGTKLVVEKQCEKCNSTGKINGKKCQACDGHGVFFKKLKCEDCNGTGYVSNKQKVTVRIVPGVLNDTKVQFRAGNNIYYFVVKIEPHETMNREGTNVFSVLNLTLLEALKGIKKEVETVSGNKLVSIPANTHNNDKIKLKGLGVPRLGDHYLITKVSYPEDTESLINFLEEKESKDEV